MEEATKRSWVEIDLARLEHNYRVIKKQLPEGTKFTGLVKANAYGHGAVEVARRLEKIGADYLAVACIDEAEELRSAGITMPILILGYTPVECCKRLIEGNITQTIYEEELAKDFSDVASMLRGTLKCHIALDTGMTRLGFSCNEQDMKESADAIERIVKLPGLQFEGIGSHFANADGDPEYSAYQIGRFNEMLKELESRGVTFELRHISASAGTLNCEASYDMVRPGIILFGCHPDPSTVGKADILPVMQWKARVASVKKVRKGTFVSYGCTYQLERDSVLAVVTAGYADGVNRKLSNQMEVLIHGKRCKQVGRVCMDMFMVDVTDLPEVQTGDVVTLFGEDGDAFLPIEELADKVGTIQYELMCNISPRIVRIYHS